MKAKHKIWSGSVVVQPSSDILPGYSIIGLTK
eukprot:CAMPEP_0206192504 /NCGR_PEP_ID=MMETSP0166-20121206/5997_1 /ASSEMBLY_ACC=CAM_ASM_000260 /TAXON_ID=95228 /ORGANISM="Vannella robusta, Strain DIVA3 518/3/11/1/6" /LENGTH=31 /DNA_ID= /DNA_START= /DNA_END= /DNA_ORIENTATION=